MKSVSMNDASCAIFAAPPLSWPIERTIRAAASSCLPRAPLTPAPARAVPTFAVRRTRPVGSFSDSLAIGPPYPRESAHERTDDGRTARARATWSAGHWDEVSKMLPPAGARVLELAGVE